MSARHQLAASRVPMSGMERKDAALIGLAHALKDLAAEARTRQINGHAFAEMIEELAEKAREAL